MTLHPAPDLAPTCVRHQDALLDFVECGEAERGVAEALDHLERCQRCTRDLAATALVVTALRRMFEEARAAETPDDAWPRLRDRIASRPVRRWRPGTVTGLLTGAALVTALLLPNAARLDDRQLLAHATPEITGSIDASLGSAPAARESHSKPIGRIADPFPSSQDQVFTPIAPPAPDPQVGPGRYLDNIRTPAVIKPSSPVRESAAASTETASRFLRPA